MDNHISDNFVAVIGILCVFGLPIAYAIAHRWWSHQERLEMIRRGITPPDPRWAKRMARHGFDPYAQTGAAPIPYEGNGHSANRQLRAGVMLAMIGLAIFIGLSFIRPGHVGPWLLGGLIPMFVGFAQILLAFMSGAQFGNWTIAPPPQRRTMPGPQPPEGPYGWRPGATTELEPPIRPPEAR